MSDIGNWLQRNWFEFGSLLVQCAILVTLAWYGSRMVTFLRAFFQYRELFREKLELVAATERGHSGRAPSAWSDLVRWLQAPMGRGGRGPFKRITRWLQTPMRGW